MEENNRTEFGKVVLGESLLSPDLETRRALQDSQRQVDAADEERAANNSGGFTAGPFESQRHFGC